MLVMMEQRDGLTKRILDRVSQGTLSFYVGDVGTKGWSYKGHS
jgi:hypothetical protein